MRFVIDAGKALGWLICCVLLVLLVPSASWSASDETEPSVTSPSSSPVPESESPSPVQPSEVASSPSSSGESSGPSDPAGTTAPPAPTETVTVTAEPSPELAPEALMAEGTEADPMIVRLDDESTALLLLTCALLAFGVGARVVGSFGGR